MSIAEQTARNIYESYHLGELPTDVKRHLVFLFFSQNPSNKDCEGEEAATLPSEGDQNTLRHRAMQAYMEIRDGKSYPADEMIERMETKYTWLCK